jgi:hypothetical protein
VRCLLVLIFLLGSIGCTLRSKDAAQVVRNYSSPPTPGQWLLVADTEKFWDDVAILHRASIRGHREAYHTLLTIQTFTDGAVAEGMPDTFRVAQQHPEMASQVIAGDNRLKIRFGHWLEEIRHPARRSSERAGAARR